MFSEDDRLTIGWLVCRRKLGGNGWEGSAWGHDK